MKEQTEEIPDAEQGVKKVSLQGTGQIELPSLNVEQYVGKKVPIALVEEFQGEYGYFIKVSTVAVTELKRQDGNVIQVCGTRNFSLQKDEHGNVGWGKDTKLGVFLKKMKVNHYKELAGKTVVLQTVTSKKDGRDYLTFN